MEPGTAPANGALSIERINEKNPLNPLKDKVGWGIWSSAHA
jgi:hypothetical protein